MASADESSIGCTGACMNAQKIILLGYPLCTTRMLNHDPASNLPAEMARHQQAALQARFSANARHRIIKHHAARSGGCFCQQTEQRAGSRLVIPRSKALQIRAKWRARFSGTRIADVTARSVCLNDETASRFQKSIPLCRDRRVLRGVTRRCSRLLDEVC
jgi:hypothetical protein